MNIRKLAQKGDEIYKRKYRKDFEKTNHGQFVAIDVTTEKCYIGSTPDEAVQKAKKDNPKGFCHLIRIGYSGVYRMETLL